MVTLSPMMSGTGGLRFIAIKGNGPSILVQVPLKTPNMYRFERPAGAMALEVENWETGGYRHPRPWSTLCHALASSKSCMIFWGWCPSSSLEKFLRETVQDAGSITSHHWLQQSALPDELSTAASAARVTSSVGVLTHEHQAAASMRL